MILKQKSGLICKATAANIVNVIESLKYQKLYTLVVTGPISQKTLKKIHTALKNCYSIINLDLLGTTGISCIGKNAFLGCFCLKSVSIPSSVKFIDEEAFINCTNLSIFIVDRANKKYVTLQDNTILLSKDGKKLLKVSVNVKGLNIPKTVKVIGKNAFSYCNLRQIIIPEGVKSIGEYAFLWCLDLEKVSISSSVKFIGDESFYGCNELTTIIVNNANKKYKISQDGTMLLSKNGKKLIKVSVKANCINIPQSVKEIGRNAFRCCCKLKNVIIPDSVKIIGNEAFGCCSELTSIDIPKKVKSIENSVFFGCSKLKNVTIPDSVKTIGNEAFCGCSELTSIGIPKKLKSIEKHAFSGCKNLKNITIPDSVKSIGEGVFIFCRNLQYVNISRSVTSIGESIFTMCDKLSTFIVDSSNKKFVASQDGSMLLSKNGKKLINVSVESKNVIIPEGVISVENSVFQQCIKMTSVTIPCSVKSIGNGVFVSCKSLTTFIVDSSNKNFVASQDGSMLLSKDGKKLIRVSVESKHVTIPNGVTSICYGAFASCHSLRTVNIPKSVTLIDAYAFFDCSSLINVNIPDEVTSIRSGVFCNCENLQSINIPKNVNVIEALLFCGCECLTRVIFSDPTSEWYYTDRCFNKVSDLIDVSNPSLNVSYFKNVVEEKYWLCKKL